MTFEAPQKLSFSKTNNTNNSPPPNLSKTMVCLKLNPRKSGLRPLIPPLSASAAMRRLPRDRSMRSTSVVLPLPRKPVITWSVKFIPVPAPKPACRASVNNTWVQSEVCRTLFGRGRGMNVPARYHNRQGPGHGRCAEVVRLVARGQVTVVHYHITLVLS